MVRSIIEQAMKAWRLQQFDCTHLNADLGLMQFLPKSKRGLSRDLKRDLRHIRRQRRTLARRAKRDSTGTELHLITQLDYLYDAALQTEYERLRAIYLEMARAQAQIPVQVQLHIARAETYQKRMQELVYRDTEAIADYLRVPNRMNGGNPA